jgi:cell division protein FtsB
MKQRGILSNILKPKLWLSLALLALLIFLLSQLWTALGKKNDLDKEIASLKEEAAQAEAQNSQFKKMIDYLQSDQFAEEQAKLKLGLKKEGEQVAVVTGLDNASNTMATATFGENTPAPVSLANNWQNWLNYFLADR